jgi:signal transduction histidine kinase
MTALVSKVERIGRGDVSAPLELPQKDEIGVLASAINVMCEELENQRATNESETRARIAALEQLRHADRLGTVGKLASGIAHELGTPLNVVSARAKMIARGQSKSDDAASDAQVIVEQVDRMTRIIRQLLDFARRRSPKRSSENIRALCAQTLQLLEPLATKNRVSLALDDDGANLTANVDPAQLQQVLTNLVMNAVQAQPDGGAVRVRVVAESADPPPGTEADAGERVIVSIEDDGSGIPLEIRDRIFEPFFTTKDVGQGTGLGLSVAYGIVKEHGGWIDVVAGPERGSVFRAHLPRGAT